MSSTTRPLRTSSSDVFTIEQRYDPKRASACRGSTGAPPHLERQQAGGVRDLLREVDLEMPDHAAARLAPARDGRERGVLEQIAEVRQERVERLPVPGVEHGHALLHTGWRFSRNASIPSTASCVLISVSR